MELPEDFRHQVTDMIGAESRLFFNVLQEMSVRSVRFNPYKKTDLRVFPVKELVPWNNLGVYVPHDTKFTPDPLFHAGAYYVQEASSMFIGYLASQLFKSDTAPVVLDLCAAPGGKSTDLLSALPEHSLIVSNEVIKSRAHILIENLQKWGRDNVIVTQNDPAHFKQLGPVFDMVVVDAPCSGEGLFRKDPQAVSAWSKDHVKHCALRQGRILEDAISALKPGGYLIYSTCTYNRSENEDQLGRLIAAGMFMPVQIAIPEGCGIAISEGEWGAAYRFYPHRLRGEGFFAGVLRKVSSEVPVLRMQKARIEQVARSASEKLKDWMIDAGQVEFLKHGDVVFCFPKGHSDFLNHVKGKLHILYAGTHLANQIHGELMPLHPAAQYAGLNHRAFEIKYLDEGEALAYLGKNLQVVPTGKKGYQLVLYGGLGLGWLKSVGHRYNNLFPTERRIRSLRSIE